MDIVLDLSDEHFFTPYVYPTFLSPQNLFRQLCSLSVIVILGGYALYFLTAALNYYLVFDHRLKLHPLYHKNQVKLEIACCLRSIPLMSFMSVIMFLAEVRGYSFLFDSFEETKFGRWSMVIYSVSFILFTDSLIYWIHRGLHSKYLYKRLHKTHHKWKIPTPFASHAFNPVDGFVQSLPYHIYVFLFPMHKWTYLGLFVFVNVWTVSIHDGNYRVPNFFKPIVNGSAHHMDHHIYYNYNYGQFFTLWDRIGRSYRTPSAFDGTGPIQQVERAEADRKRRQDQPEVPAPMLGNKKPGAGKWEESFTHVASVSGKKID
ncbi:Lathosterol oxidase [Hypsibius exemplaris]|uniref:Lathosterol oxidase n=1 Tax=Hypsibius exemplaris TaxID=2072580 RepID=A0A1W0WQT7_HYPEX|nr:Lathosterol oxidase [Hypsibius exemplaris]